MSGGTDAPDLVVGALEDGYRPPADPHDWKRVYSVVTGKPCPACGTALGVLLGPTEAVDDVAAQIQDDHGGTLSDGWSDGYEQAIYLYCDSPLCPWHGAAEWAEVRPVFEAWIQGGAPTWRDQVEVSK